jgi:hypothetical protein
MVKATLRVAVEDPLVTKENKIPPDIITIKDEPFFLNGPVAERVAVVDRDPKTGRLAKPVPWLPKKGEYDTRGDICSPRGIAVSAFGIVLDTLKLFEQPDILGRRITWAFDSPQLLIVPHAGTWENAFYDRYSRSLQCFNFAAPNGATVRTALSRDIIAHETGHAILDGLIRPLYDALTPQTLALHETVGDLTAIVMALRSRSVRGWLLEKGGDLAGSTLVSQLASEFGQAIGLNHPLRDACNSKAITKVKKEPHDLCQVLTGALWAAMVQLHRHALDEANRQDPRAERGPRGKALWLSSSLIGRILFRALDYLVPAEATFADYGRAILVSDKSAFPEDKTGYRDVLIKEFLSRGIISDASQLESAPEPAPIAVNLDDIKESDWAAFAFVERERKLLKIPPGVPFRLLPRQEAMRTYYLGKTDKIKRRELILRMTWESIENNVGISRMPSKRAVFMGTTAVFTDIPNDPTRARLLSCLTTDTSADHREARNETVRLLAERDQLEIGGKAASFNTRPLSPSVFGRVTDDTLRLRGTARLLHLAGAET